MRIARTRSLESEKKSRLETYLWEIKGRCSYILFSFVCAFATAYSNSTCLLYLFLLSYFDVNSRRNAEAQVAQQIKFVFVDVHEAFYSTIFICLVFCFLVVTPLVLYMCFVFLAPSLHETESRKLLLCLCAFLMFWIAFLCALQFAVLPNLCFFFLQFKVESACLVIGVETRIISYLDWVVGMFTIFSTVFVLVCLFVLSVVHYQVHPSLLSSRRSLSAWLLLVAAAFFSPPDIVSELFFAGVLFLGFETLLVFLFVLNRFESKKSSF